MTFEYEYFIYIIHYFASTCNI